MSFTPLRCRFAAFSPFLITWRIGLGWWIVHDTSDNNAYAARHNPAILLGPNLSSGLLLVGKLSLSSYQKPLVKASPMRHVIRHLGLGSKDRNLFIKFLVYPVRLRRGQAGDKMQDVWKQATRPTVYIKSAITWCFRLNTANFCLVRR